MTMHTSQRHVSHESQSRHTVTYVAGKTRSKRFSYVFPSSQNGCYKIIKIKIRIRQLLKPYFRRLGVNVGLRAVKPLSSLKQLERAPISRNSRDKQDTHSSRPSNRRKRTGGHMAPQCATWG